MLNQKKVVFLGILFSFFLICAFPSNAQKLNAEDVLAKHLESIGTAENRAAVKNYVFMGDAKFKTTYQASPVIEGKAVLASEEHKMLLNLGFNSFNYQQELINFDGKKPKIDFISPGVRSPLGAFLVTQDNIIANSLLGGVLFKTWTLLNSPETKAKLTLDGTKKINGVECYVIDYNLRKGSDSLIKLYFDSQTFRHVRTEYKRTLTNGNGPSLNAANRAQESRQILTEEFSNFKTINNLTLPQNYQLSLTNDGHKALNQFQWNINISEFLFNQKLNPKSFESSAD